MLTDGGVVLRDGLGNDGICSDEYVIADNNVSENFRPGTDNNVISDGRMSLGSWRHLLTVMFVKGGRVGGGYSSDSNDVDLTIGGSSVVLRSIVIFVACGNLTLQ